MSIFPEFDRQDATMQRLARAYGLVEAALAEAHKLVDENGEGPGHEILGLLDEALCQLMPLRRFQKSAGEAPMNVPSPAGPL